VSATSDQYLGHTGYRHRRDSASALGVAELADIDALTRLADEVPGSHRASRRGADLGRERVLQDVVTGGCECRTGGENDRIPHKSRPAALRSQHECDVDGYRDSRGGKDHVQTGREQELAWQLGDHGSRRQIPQTETDSDDHRAHHVEDADDRRQPRSHPPEVLDVGHQGG
jgi:hypothetical protein